MRFTLIGLPLSVVLGLSLFIPNSQQTQSKSSASNTVQIAELAASLEGAASEQEQEQLLASRKEIVNSELLGALMDRAEARFHDAEYAKATKVLKIAIRIAERIGDQVALGNAWLEMGNIYNQQNRSVEALDCFQKTLPVAEATRDRTMKMRALYGMGLAYSRQSLFDRAQEYYEQCLPISKDLGDRNYEAKSLSDLGNAHSDQGRVDVGLELLTKSLRICEELGDTGTLSVVLNNIGTHYIYRGRYADALEYLHRGIKLFEQVGSKADEEGLAIKLLNIGLIYRRQGRPDQALVYYQKSLKLMEALDHKMGIANLQNNIGVAYKSQGFHEQSIEWFQKSLTRYEALAAKGGIARTLNNIGDAYRLLGRYDQALENLNASLRLREEIHDRPGISLTLTNMGNLYRAQRKYAEMLEAGQRAASVADGNNDRERLWNAQEIMGAALLAMGRPREARQHFVGSISTIESLRHDVAGEQQQQSFLENRLAPWFGMVGLLVSQNEYAEALSFAERSKARVLLDALMAGRPNLRESLSVDEGKEEEKRRLHLVQLNSELTREVRRDKPDRIRVEELRVRIERARLEYEDLEATLYAAHPELRVRRGEVSIITRDELGSLLPDANGALLEYVVADDRTYLFVITKAGGESKARAEGSGHTQ